MEPVDSRTETAPVSDPAAPSRPGRLLLNVDTSLEPERPSTPSTGTSTVTSTVMPPSPPPPHRVTPTPPPPPGAVDPSTTVATPTPTPTPSPTSDPVPDAAPDAAPDPVPAPVFAPSLDGRDQTAEAPKTPAFAPETVSAAPSEPDRRSTPRRLPMAPLRILATGSVVVALLLVAAQVARVLDEQPRLSSLTWGSLVAAMVAAGAIVGWTWVATENARRILDPARTQELPSPGHAVATWVVPMVFVAGAAASVAYLSRRLNTPIEGTESSLPLILGLIATLFLLPLLYGPIGYLSGVVRRVGGKGARIGDWVWIPVALAVVAGAVVFALRWSGMFADEEAGTPTWVVGVAALVPCAVFVLLGWRAGDAVEADIARAFDRRLGIKSNVSTRRGLPSLLHVEEGPDHTALRNRDSIRQIPGANLVGLVVTAGMAGAALVSVIGALVMFLFWRETLSGDLLASQSERAWEVIETLHRIERLLTLAAVVAVSTWSFVAVSNVRLASARHRNPVLAAAAWPAAALAVWSVGARFVSDGTVGGIVAGFVLQAAAVYVPFLVLERSATSVGSVRNPFRVTWALVVVVLVHVQGLGGLSNVSVTGESAEVGRLAGYLAIGALVQLLAMFSASSAMRGLVTMTERVALRHNTLVAQRRQGAPEPGQRLAAPRLAPSEVRV